MRANSIGYYPFFIATLGLLASYPCAGDTLVLVQGQDGYTGFEDTTIFDENENSGGGTDGIFAGTNGQFQTRRALIRADLSAIPAGSVINGVSLQMRVEMSGENFGDIDYTLHRLTNDWGEGNVVGLSEGGFGGPPQPGDATWVSNFFGTLTWAILGGDFVGTPSATAAAGFANTFVTWSSVGMTADVQAWVNNPSSNFGWIVVSTIEGQFKRVKKFYSSEATQFRPELTVDYTPAANAPIRGFSLLWVAVVLCAAAIGSLGSRRRRRLDPLQGGQIDVSAR